MTIDSLNKEYAIQDQLVFYNELENKIENKTENKTSGKDDFPFIKIDNKHASAVISVYGGQVLSFHPHALKQETDLLFVSDKAFYQHGKAIKGGIPICWPWFGKDPEDLGRASHGFARNLMWSVKETTTTSNGDTRVSLRLSDTAGTRSIWPHSFNLTLNITVGQTLKLELLTQNTGNEKFTITQALHTYFSIGDIHQTQVDGLDGIEYIDTTLSEWPTIKQKDSVTFSEEVDRIYMNVPPELTLLDNELKRQTHITSSGSNSSVIWNPWAKKATEMADLDDNNYLKFVCIETTNAASDTVDIRPNETFCLTAEYKTDIV